MSFSRIILRTTLALVAAFVAAQAHAAIYVYHCILDPRQETTANLSTAQGAGRFVIDTDANTVTYRIVFGGLLGTETSAHIHGSATSVPGSGGGLLTPLPLGNPKVGVWNYTEAQEPFILGGLTYANIHTSAAPSGEIRGQIVPFNALLDPAQETTPNSSTGKGWATATVDTAANTISYYISYAGLSGTVTGAHFHGSKLHATGGGSLKAALTVTPSPMTGTVSYNQADEAGLLSGMFYVNLHTAASPGGEIRGQMVPNIILLDAQQESPATAATGSAAFALVAVDTALKSLSYDMRVVSLSGAETGGHIHGFAGAAGTAGPLASLAAGAQKVAIWNYGAANQVDVMRGLAYFNLHTAANGGGEIRGQIDRLAHAAAVLDVPVAPRAGASLAAAPNPFVRRTVLSFQLARTSRVSMSLVGVDGRRVRHVADALFAPGAHSLEWDGLDDDGHRVAPGVYFAVVETAEGKRTTRVVRLD